MSFEESMEDIIDGLKKRGFKYSKIDKAENCIVYKYIGNKKILKKSIVKIWKYEEGFYGFLAKAELIVGNKRFKDLSIEGLFTEIDHIIKKNNLSNVIQYSDW